MERLPLLVDLSVAADGYSGIPQDTRVIFSLLRSSPSLDVSGLLYPRGHAGVPRIGPGAFKGPAAVATILHAVANPQSPPPAGRLGTLLRRASSLRNIVRASHEVLEVPAFAKTDALWRILFQQSLDPARRAELLSGRFYVSDLTVRLLHARSLVFPFLPPKRLEVAGHAALWLPTPRPIAVPPGVTKVVRYHDSVPITDPDTVVSAHAPIEHFHALQACSGDSIFVCNSPQSRASLAELLPGAENRSVVVPCAVEPIPAASDPPVAGILDRRTARAGAAGFERLGSEPGSRALRYIAAVSTLEPRKNLVAVIRAWELLRGRRNVDIKLVLVANDGWGTNTAVHAAMEPHVRRGDLLHVKDLARDELHALYRSAEIVVALPFQEGFGLTPLEALSAGAPVLASDIPVLRWSLGDAALFADPYSVSHAAQQLERLLDLPENEERRAALRASAARCLDRFSPATIQGAWEAFFGETFYRLRENLPARAAEPNAGRQRLARLLPVRRSG
jgi:glycosyltransferase involved in cell wall biosynthesis